MFKKYICMYRVVLWQKIKLQFIICIEIMINIKINTSVETRQGF